MSAIVVNYKTREMTLRCLDDLSRDLASYPSEIIVVDNASDDGSVAAIQARFPSVIVIENERNVGFGAANNDALEVAQGQYLLFVNSDAFLHPGCSATLLNYLEGHPEVGLVGPRLENRDGSLQRSCWRFPSALRSWAEALWIPGLLKDHPVIGDYRFWKHDEIRQVDFVIGACMMARREVYATIGGFDLQFFMYQEEADWQKRIHDRGWKVCLVPQACATHLGGASAKDETVRVSRQFLESLDRYILKHHGTVGFLSVRLALIFGNSLRALIWVGLAIFPRWRSRAVGRVQEYWNRARRQIVSGRPC